MKNKILFLGTGASVGVPVIGCHCQVCTSCDPLNKRGRPSALVTCGNKRFLIDAGPDFRWQALCFHIENIDAVLLTHAHHDHICGLDDLRPIYYRRGRSIPLVLSKETADEVCLRYHYLFAARQNQAASHFTATLLPDWKGSVDLEGEKIGYLTYSQAGVQVTGYQIGRLAYLSDIKHFSSSIFEDLKEVDCLVISALRHKQSPLHFNLEEALHFASQLPVKQVWLTHISHELEHRQTNEHLPPHVRLAYDGLEIEF